MAHKELADSKELLSFYINSFVVITFDKDRSNSNLSQQANFDVALLSQMLLSKLLHLRKVIDGVSFTNKSLSLPSFIDPTLVGMITRNIFEIWANFNLNFIYPENDDQRLLIYNCWQIAGLKAKQHFGKKSNTAKNIEIAKEEREAIASLTAEIIDSELYNNYHKTIEDPKKDKVKLALKKKDWKFAFNPLRLLPWAELHTEMHVKAEFFDSIYSYFSQYTHPSYVSVFQYHQLFKPESRDFEMLTNFHLRFTFAFISFFISDYINLFPEAKSTFNDFDSMEQKVLLSYNDLYRE